MTETLSWIEISRSALEANTRTFRRLVGPDVKLLGVVKANAYGHGVDLVAPAVLDAGADGLAVYSAEEGIHLREVGITAPILLLGYLRRQQMASALRHRLDITVFNPQTLSWLSEAAERTGAPARVHLKVETGTHRQGFDIETFEQALKTCDSTPWLSLQGLSTHFANIEDTTVHTYARWQLDRFRLYLERAEGYLPEDPWVHTACSAAAILFEDTYFTAARVGISLYGLWPSKETYLSSLQQNGKTVELKPALTWKTLIGQTKSIPAGAYVGYGCTFRATRDSRLAILPVGYADGYDRHLSNTAHVLINGKRAPIRGRVCMNVSMADISDLDEARLEDEVVLLGRQGDEVITAEMLADWCGTINYEIVTRIAGHLPRRLVA